MQIFFPPLRMRPVAINFIESLCKVNQNCVSLALFVQQCYPIVDCEDQLCSAQSSRLKAASIWVIHSHQLRRAISWWTSIIVSQYKMEKKKNLPCLKHTQVRSTADFKEKCNIRNPSIVDVIKYTYYLFSSICNRWVVFIFISFRKAKHSPHWHF